ncbi:hypothetical protein ACWERV_14540 [Streptomyces sp. NPDC004031]
MSASRGSGGLYVALEDLCAFRTRVDALLADLDASYAAPQRVAEQRVASARFGTGFGAAEDLAAAYTDVHGRLEQLSQTLADQIEALGLSLRIGHKTFADVDLDTQRRLRALGDRLLHPAHGPGPDGGAEAVGTAGTPGTAGTEAHAGSPG